MDELPEDQHIEDFLAALREVPRTAVEGRLEALGSARIGRERRSFFSLRSANGLGYVRSRPVRAPASLAALVAGKLLW